MIYVIIPVHNRKEFTRGCLQSLQAQTYRDFQTIVIDDGSTDGTATMIAAEFPEVKVLSGDGQLWWTKAINWGVRYVLERADLEAHDAVLTLNDDLMVAPDYLASIVADQQQQQVPCLMGSVSVDINNPTYLEYAGTACNYITGKTVRLSRRFANNLNCLKASHSVLASDDLPGRGTLIPVAVFQQVGLYDERNFPHYMADIELSVRARRAGFPLFVSVGSVIHNYIGATRNKRQSWRSFLNGFTSFMAPNYLRTRYVFALRHSPIKHLYFLLDISRITASFLRSRFAVE